jgi:hypothetical protein
MRIKRTTGTNILVGGHVNVGKMGVLLTTLAFHPLARSFHP